MSLLNCNLRYIERLILYKVESSQYFPFRSKNISLVPYFILTLYIISNSIISRSYSELPRDINNHLWFPFKKNLWYMQLRVASWNLCSIARNTRMKSSNSNFSYILCSIYRNDELHWTTPNCKIPSISAMNYSIIQQYVHTLSQTYSERSNLISRSPIWAFSAPRSETGMEILDFSISYIVRSSVVSLRGERIKTTCSARRLPVGVNICGLNSFKWDVPTYEVLCSEGLNERGLWIHNRLQHSGVVWGGNDFGDKYSI